MCVWSIKNEKKYKIFPSFWLVVKVLLLHNGAGVCCFFYKKTTTIRRSVFVFWVFSFVCFWGSVTECELKMMYEAVIISTAFIILERVSAKRKITFFFCKTRRIDELRLTTRWAVDEKKKKKKKWDLVVVLATHIFYILKSSSCFFLVVFLGYTRTYQRTRHSHNNPSWGSLFLSLFLRRGSPCWRFNCCLLGLLCVCVCLLASVSFVSSLRKRFSVSRRHHWPIDLSTTDIVCYRTIQFTYCWVLHIWRWKLTLVSLLCGRPQSPAVDRRSSSSNSIDAGPECGVFVILLVK